MLTITGIIEGLPDSYRSGYAALVSIDIGQDISSERSDPGTFDIFWSIHLHTYALFSHSASITV